MNEELKVVISAEIDKLKNGINQAKQHINSFNKQVTDASKNADKNLKKAGEYIGKAFKTGCKIAATAVTSVATAVGGLTVASVKSYAEYEQLIGGVEKLFGGGYETVEDYTKAIGKSTDSIKEFQKANGLAVDGIIGAKTKAAIEASYKSLGNVSETVIKNAQNAYKTAGISANDYMTQITSFSASLISSLGGDTKKAAEIGDMAIRDMSDNANVFGSNIQDIQNAYQGFAKQNYTMLDNLKLGYGGTKEEMQRLIDDANKVKEAMGENADLTIDSYADVIEAIHIVQNEMGITGTTASEASKTISGSIQATKAAWENLMIGLADSNANIPELVGNVVSSATDVLKNIIPVIKEVLLNIPVAIGEISPQAGAAFQAIIDAIMAILPTLQTALQTTFDVIVSTINFVSEHTGVIAGVAAAIGTVVAAIELYNAVQAIRAAMDAAEVTTLGALISAKLASAAATIAAIAPYALIVAAIAAVIAIIVLCVKNWDVIKAKVVEVASAIWAKVQEMAAKVAEFFGNMGEAISTAVSNAKEAAVNKFNEIASGIQEKVSAAKEAVSTKFNEIATNVKQKVADAKTAAVNKFTEIKTNISNKVTEAKTAVANKFGEIATTVGTKAGEALTKAKEKFDSIKTSISDAISGAKQIVADKIADIKSALGLSGFSWKIPKPSFPKFSVSGGKAPWGFMGEGSLPKISISWNAMGGVFENPTVRHFGNSLQGLAENGAEAIVPLENNLGWLDKLASMLNDRMGGNQPIVLTVDGKVFAQTTIDSINNLTRQTGTLALNIV